MLHRHLDLLFSLVICNFLSRLYKTREELGAGVSMEEIIGKGNRSHVLHGEVVRENEDDSQGILNHWTMFKATSRSRCHGAAIFLVITSFFVKLLTHQFQEYVTEFPYVVTEQPLLREDSLDESQSHCVLTLTISNYM